jgi:hypothetical protein
MTAPVDRRRLGLGLAAAALLPAGAARAGAGGFEGTWGGATGDLTAQVIVAGGEVIGFYWHGDYRDARAARFSADGNSLSFAFDGGQAVLTRTGDRAAGIVITEGGKVTRLALARD